MVWVPPSRLRRMIAVPEDLSAVKRASAKPTVKGSGASLSSMESVNVPAALKISAPRWSTIAKVPNFIGSASASSGALTRISLTRSPSAKVTAKT